jgi:uncharacterized phiE125 gp8 family phage protein
MWNALERTSAPVTEIVTTAEAKAQCRIDHSDDDTLINRLIKVAREKLEGPNGIGICFVSQGWRLSLDRFPREIRVPMGPVLSIDSITYVDEGGQTQTLDANLYQWRKERFGARIAPAYDQTWPIARCVYDAVQVNFTAGFPGTEDSPANLTNVPETLKHAMLLLVGHYYENREAVLAGEMPEMPYGFENIVNQYLVGRIA